MEYVKRCPRCASDRPAAEQFCEGELDSKSCGYPLHDVALASNSDGGIGDEHPSEPAAVPDLRRCTNGHPVETDDTICLACGADLAPSDAGDVVPEPLPTPPDEAPERPSVEVDGWRVAGDIGAGGRPWRRFDVIHSDGRIGVLTRYEGQAEPDADVHDVLRRMDSDHIPQLFATGRSAGHAYEVTERITGGSLRDAGAGSFASPDQLALVVDEVGRALADFAAHSLRHRDLNPGNILFRSRDPLDLVITGFGSARLSDYDMEAVAPLELTMYSAPEAIVGGVSAASDWWSLGMVVLELATVGRCFANVNEQAFRIHVVTRGVTIPAELDERVQLLLRGLLTRDPLSRWQWPQVQAWLAGESPVAASDARPVPDDSRGPALELARTRYTRPESYALAAAEGVNWEEGRRLTIRGAVTTWLEERGAEGRTIAAVRRIIADEELSEDLKHALVLMLLNSALPLVMSGELVTPGFLLANPEAGYELITGQVCTRLSQMQREPWLTRLQERAAAVRERARVLEIELDEERLRVLLLATSRGRLEVERAAVRALLPDSDHRGLAPLLENVRITDEELILLLGAATHQFVPLEELVTKAGTLASQAAVGTFDADRARELLAQPRRDVYKAIDEQTAAFARCSIDLVNEWADSYRVERRISLPRAVVLLAVPAGEWKQPPKQEYVAKLLGHFERRVVRAVQRGPLVRFTIGKSTPRVDLAELSTPSHPGDAILDHLVRRMESPVDLDPTMFVQRPEAHTRLRRMVSNALTFRRDTGIDGRYLGFPFLLMKDERLASPGSRVRIAPVLLWPVTIDLPIGAAGRATIAFDREREEVRFNPALDGLLGREDAERWTHARDELLGRSQIRISDVLDIFGVLAEPSGRHHVAIPKGDTTLRRGERKLCCAAALFNAEFVGQAVAEDLRNLARQPIAGTSLASALRIDGATTPPTVLTQQNQPTSAHDLFLTVPSDPSQEAAVRAARSGSGLLVQGPPGTGKSQTIVNIVSDCIGRGESVLVVCQKQAAIDVVKKRLDAEGLSDRLMVVRDVNKDRRPILQGIRDQLDRLGMRSSPRTRLKADRNSSLVQLERLDGELNDHQVAVRETDDCAGLSYREVVAALVRLEARGVPIDVPRLRRGFATVTRGRLEELKLVIAPLASLWLKARFESSPLHVTKQFSVDDAVAEDVADAIEEYKASEVARARVQADNHPTFRIDDPVPYSEWLRQWDSRLSTLPEQARLAVKRWMNLFRARTMPGEGDELIGILDSVLREADALRGPYPAERMQGIAQRLQIDRLRQLVTAAQRATAPSTFWSKFSIPRWRATKRFEGWLAEVRVAVTEREERSMCATLVHELHLRPMRSAVHQVRDQLSLGNDTPLITLARVVEEATRLKQLLTETRDVVEGARSCPRSDVLFTALAIGTSDAYAAFGTDISAALARHFARVASVRALAGLSEWFVEEWVDRHSDAIAGEDEPDVGGLLSIVEALPTLAPFQQFRGRIAAIEAVLRKDVLAVLAVLRSVSGRLLALPTAELQSMVSRILDREALLAWKSRLQAQRVALTLERSEVEQRVGLLAEVDEALRKANRALLAQDHSAPLGARDAWEAITRLQGPRALRLREFFDQAMTLGLMRVRPVWLMNPDTASRLLPLRAKCFDVVVFDEASQMLVEHAVPTLFRGKRVVVSGDEKQMPPTSFFLGRGGDEEEEAEFDGTEFEEELSEAERSVLEDTWNRRDIKDCPDLLALGSGFLSTTTLQVHYRSKYRELIEFSNAAFYGGKLSVPARHPDAEIRRVRPIEVIRVEGVYQSQTNPQEAQRVVEELARIWSEGGDAPPSIGIVTFNRRQADLVEDVIAERVTKDDAFRRAYVRERDRVQGGEDMGFFVKNVENVQGDERDVIIFSTTFGRDSGGAFRRFFGVLGQAGGERRLNVAVTRARAKVILATSMPIRDVSDFLQSTRRAEGPRDYLQAYLDYATKVSDGDLDGARALCRRFLAGGAAQEGRMAADGDAFVESVAEFLRERGYAVVVGAESDAFALDIAVVDPRSGQFALAIECDAPVDRAGHLRTARARELWRPSVLRRAIPEVHRVTVKEWYERRGEEEGRLEEALTRAVAGAAA